MSRVGVCVINDAGTQSSLLQALSPHHSCRSYSLWGWLSALRDAAPEKLTAWFAGYHKTISIPTAWKARVQIYSWSKLTNSFTARANYGKLRKAIIKELKKEKKQKKDRISVFGLLPHPVLPPGTGGPAWYCHKISGRPERLSLFQLSVIIFTYFSL